MSERDIFIAALQTEDPAQRQAYLDEACAGQRELRQQVEHLLRLYQGAGSFLESPAAEPVAPVTIDQPVLERPGMQIGPYKLMEQIGEGGMGLVFVAEQHEPVRRKVALKLIKPGMDTRECLARFDAERQALALMDHPNIARVLDAGATASGRPYFVMELVKGVPITQFCDGNRLAPRERLELFADVCHAVQHAHQKGIIHRDIKPNNVLVSSHDGRPVVKVIDFGVAKAVGQQLTEKTLYTNLAQMVGTPLYMSPEQAGMSGLDIDTRTDIYSLGVLLYELLTGTTPFDKERLKLAAYEEMRRIICEEEPQKPSTRISTTDAAPSIATCRHMEPSKLAKLVRGELDWIVMKALEKDRNRRYETASGFALDVQRYLADEPVQACPPSAAYRVRKFAVRNKGPVVVVCLISLALIIGIVGTTWGMIRATDAEADALRESGEKTVALREKETALSTAKANEIEAHTQTIRAEKNATAAKEQELLARRRFYAAQINLAQQALETGQPARTLELLESLRPRIDQDDLRGFEWYYLWRLCHQNLHRTLGRPRGTVAETLAITPDGTTVVSGYTDASVRVWDVATGKERAALLGHKRRVWRVAISPDGQTLASGSLDNTVRLWDLANSALLATLTVGDSVRSVAFSPDGKTLAVGTESGALEFWDVSARKRRFKLPALSAPTLALAYSPDGKLLATGQGWKQPDMPGGVKVLDVTSEPPRLLFQGELVISAAFSPDSKLLATCKGAAVKIWSVPAVELKATFASLTSGVESVVFSADGKSIIFGCHDRTVRLWEFASGATRIVGVHLGGVQAVAIVPKSDLLASASEDGTVKLWKAGLSQDEATFAHDSAIRSLAFTPDNKLLIVGSDRLTTVLDANTGKKTTTLPVSGVIAASADASLLAASTPDKTGVIWEVAAERTRAVLPVGADLAGAAFSSDNKALVAWKPDLGTSSHTEGACQVWDVQTSRVRLALKVPEMGNVHCAAFSPDGRTLATARQFGTVTLWDATTGQQRVGLRNDDDTLRDAVTLAYSRDGKLLAAGDTAGNVRLWNAETGELKASLKGHTQYVGAVVFSPDGRTLLSCSSDKTARLWDVVTGQELLSLKGTKFSVHRVAFGPDGKRLATTSRNEVKLWFAATEPEATTFRMELDPDDVDSPRAMNDWGDRLQELDRHEEAETTYRSALARLEKLAAADPDIPEYSQELAYSHYAAWVSQNPEQAQTAEQQRLIREVYHALSPEQQHKLAVRYMSLSSRLAAARDPTLRNPSRAVELAKKAVQLSSYVRGTGLDTSGVAHYRAGDWKGAIEELHKSMDVRNRRRLMALGNADLQHPVAWPDRDEQLLTGTDVRNLFILSMANWKVNAKDEAGKWYKVALAWTEAWWPKHAEYLSLRDEAAALLGLSTRIADLAPQALTDPTNWLTLYLDADPKGAWAHRSRGRIHLGRDNYDHALLDFARVTDLEPLDPDAWYARGVAHYRLKRHPEAVADLSRALILNEGHVWAEALLHQIRMEEAGKGN
jgi:WD40 repeat protein/serine/threonine protein kinase/tetratricopeptide (TPR) repeat protein